MHRSPWLEIDETAPVSFRIERESDHGGIRLRYLRYFSHRIGDFPLEMAAVLAVPPAPGPRPALLHLHGGAQCAQADIALSWAKRGYVTLCPDWSLPANSSGAAHATRWPEKTPPTHAVSLEAGETTIGHIVRAARRGLSLLTALPEVQPGRIGMVGISWGGLMTWLVNGTDSRLRAAIAVYGSGRAANVAMSDSWRKNFQPESVAATQHAPILHLNGTHDFFGHLETSEALQHKIGPKARRLYVPNEDHGLSDAARRSAWAWLHRLLCEDCDIPTEPDIRPAPGKRFFHARSMDRRAVWRERSDIADLPESGCLFATETHPDGLAFSSPVHCGSPRPPEASTVLWDAGLHGTDGLFLRWEQENLAVHAPANAQLTADKNEVRFSPAAHPFRVFLRAEIPPGTPLERLSVTLTAPAKTRVQLQGFPGPEIEEASVTEFETRTCERDGSQTLTLNPLTPPSPDGLTVFRITLTSDNSEPSNIALHSVHLDEHHA
ncbi:MAG: dienelactone hydrolase family protein [Verrucomicrobia bacterium]|nr:dienelactone hydrolase family protein [Verrucomicrobiota bacterium]MCH8525788.1 dienelactone hydrolase family protein [Kiritimatiellia bacterium]